jgi:periplasmic protein TonB
MSHELFHDVTDRRPRTGRASGGTLAVSIVAHALILSAVVVVPLLATDVLPSIADGGLGPYVLPVVPPAPVPPPMVNTRTPTTAAVPTANVAPVVAPDHIAAETPRPVGVPCDYCVVDPTASTSAFRGIEGGTGVDAAQPPPVPPTPKIVRATALNMPKKVHDVAPEYPAIARSAGVEGVVIIEAVIAVDGSVRDARVLRSQPLLDRAAVDAVRQWRYEPTRLNGVPVPVIVTVTVQFRLQR